MNIFKILKKLSSPRIKKESYLQKIERYKKEYKDYIQVNNNICFLKVDEYNREWYVFPSSEHDISYSKDMISCLIKLYNKYDN